LSQEPAQNIQVQKIANGDTCAFEELFFLYCQPLISFCQRYVLDKQIAENIVQDVFVRIWQNREKLNPSQHIKSYLYTAVKNQALKHLRHRDVINRSSIILKNMICAVKTPEDECHEKETANIIHQTIQQLPEKCRIIFSMNRFDQLTYAEIASIQNISIKTVETQMGRALKFLRKQLIHLINI